MTTTRLRIPRIYQPLARPNRYKVYYGGRGGGKSWAFATILLFMALQKSIRILCTRELQKSIADSVHKLLCDLIIKYGLEEAFTITHTSIKSDSGSEFIFAGLRSNISEIKSMEGIDICWVEEAQAVSEESWKILIPTIRKENSEIWISFNPDSIDDPTFKRFVLNPPPGSVVQKINYNQNPFFPETLRREMEWDRKVDYEKYLWVWEGEPRAMTDAQVFKGKYKVDVFDTPTDAVFYYGADWGFAQDPTVLVRCFIKDNCLYIDHEAYGVGVDIDDTPALFRTVPGAEQWIITADSARPETISYMRKQGFNIRPAEKGKGSVEDGIAFMRSFDVIVVHERCKHTAQELKLYSYKVDRLTGDVLPVLVDAHNHSIDATRYGLEKLIKPKFTFTRIEGVGAI